MGVEKQHNTDITNTELNYTAKLHSHPATIHTFKWTTVIFAHAHEQELFDKRNKKMSLQSRN